VPFPLIPAAFLLAAAASTAGVDPLRSLVEAERGFSSMSVDQGMRAAFLANLAEDGIVFQPLPVNGKQVWQARSKSAAVLIWEPAFAEVAAAGDLGYTTGPWEYHPPAEAKNATPAYGHFISVWKRAGAGPWKVAVDLGASHEKTEPGVGSGEFTAGPTHGKAPKDDRGESSERAVRAAEQSFSSAAERSGFSAAFGTCAASDVRFNREGISPAVGIAAARRAVSADRARAHWTPQGAGASRSGDLGYAYGIRERTGTAGAAPDTSVYLDVWRRESSGHWRLVMAVDNPVERGP
jgi:ketosteroid isomerase-like protein